MSEEKQKSIEELVDAHFKLTRDSSFICSPYPMQSHVSHAAAGISSVPGTYLGTFLGVKAYVSSKVPKGEIWAIYENEPYREPIIVRHDQ